MSLSLRPAAAARATVNTGLSLKEQRGWWRRGQSGAVAGALLAPAGEMTAMRCPSQDEGLTVEELPSVFVCRNFLTWCIFLFGFLLRNLMCLKIPVTLPVRLQVPLKEAMLFGARAQDVGGVRGHLRGAGMCGLCFLSHLDRERGQPRRYVQTKQPFCLPCVAG